jgi:hypothetical protein
MQLTIILNLVQTLRMIQTFCLDSSVCVLGVHRDNFIFIINCISRSIGIECSIVGIVRMEFVIVPKIFEVCTIN